MTCSKVTSELVSSPFSMNTEGRTLRRSVLLGLGVVFLTLATGFALQQEGRYQFRVTVDLISLNVTVTDTRSRFVTDLLQDNFSIFEDGIKQDISVFSREDLPIRLVLLLDTSASMDEKMGFAQEAAVSFVQTLKNDDDAQVVEFGSKARVLQPFTADKKKLTRAIRMTQAGGTTSLHNALYIALKNLSRRRQDIRRQAIIVLSDGEDTSSLVTFEQVMELSKDTDVTCSKVLTSSGVNAVAHRQHRCRSLHMRTCHRATC